MRAAPTSKDFGEHAKLSRAENAAHAAPALGENEAFDAKVLALQSLLRSGTVTDAAQLSLLADGSTAPRDEGREGFEDEVEREMGKLRGEIEEEARRTLALQLAPEKTSPPAAEPAEEREGPGEPPGEPPRAGDRAARNRAHGEALRQQIAAERARGAPAPAGGGGALVPEPRDDRKEKNRAYGEALRQQMAAPGNPPPASPARNRNSSFIPEPQDDRAAKNRAYGEALRQQMEAKPSNLSPPSPAHNSSFIPEPADDRAAKNRAYGEALRQQMAAAPPPSSVSTPFDPLNPAIYDDRLGADIDKAASSFNRDPPADSAGGAPSRFQHLAPGGRGQNQPPSLPSPARGVPAYLQQAEPGKAAAALKQRQYASQLAGQIDERNRRQQQERLDNVTAPPSYSSGPGSQPTPNNPTVSPARYRAELRQQQQQQMSRAAANRQAIAESDGEVAAQVRHDREREARIQGAARQQQEDKIREAEEKQRKQREYADGLRRQQQQVGPSQPAGGDVSAATSLQIGGSGEAAAAARLSYAEELRLQIDEKQALQAAEAAASHKNGMPAYFQQPSAVNNPRYHQDRGSPPRQQQRGYEASPRVPPHRDPRLSPPSSPRFFPSEMGQHGGGGFGRGVGSLYKSDVVEQMRGGVQRQSKAEYARQLEQQIREKEASKKQARVDRITDEKQYLSPADKQHTKPVHVSPAYEDHIASTLHPRGYTEHAQPSQPTYDSNQPQNNAAADAKQQYADALRLQMQENEARKARVKKEQEDYEMQFAQPVVQQQQDNVVEGPLGNLVRVGGGGDMPTSDTHDLHARRNQIKANSFNDPSPSKVPGAGVRQQMVADVYGETGAGAALGFSKGISSPPPQLNQLYGQPQHGQNPIPNNSQLSYKEQLQLQMEEKRLEKEAEKRKMKLEEEEEMRKILVEAERVRQEQAEEKAAKKIEEQKQLDFLIAQQEAAAVKRRNGVGQKEKAPAAEAPPPVPSDEPALPSARSAHSQAEPTMQVRKAPPAPRLRFKPSIPETPAAAPAEGGGVLAPGDFFHIDLPAGGSTHREDSPFTKNMNALRSSLDEDVTEPLRDFQNRLHSHTTHKQQETFNQYQEQYGGGGGGGGAPPGPTPRRGGDGDMLEQSLAAESEFHMLEHDSGTLFNPAQSQSFVKGNVEDIFSGAGGGGGGGGGGTVLMEAEEEPSQADVMDAFVKKWQTDNGFSATTGGYDPHRKLATGARSDAKMPNFRALNQITSTRHFLHGDPSGTEGMARVGAPPVPGQVGTGVGMFASDDYANVAEVFGAKEDTGELPAVGGGGGGELMGASLKSDSLLMYLDDKEKEQFKSDLGKVEEGAGEDTEEVGELRDVEPAAVVVPAAHVEVERPIRDVVRASPPQPSWGFSYDSDEEDEVVVVEGGGATAKREALLDDFVVQSVSDEQKQMMEDAQKKKSWGQVPEDAAGRAEAADALRQKMEGASGEDGEDGEDGVDGVNGEDGEDESDDDGLMPAPSPQHLPRTNSEVAVLKKLEELEQKLGVGDGEGGEEEEEEEEEYEDDVEEDEGDVMVVEEKKELTFTEKWLPNAPKANAELVFVTKEEEAAGGEVAAEQVAEVDDEEEEEEGYSSDEDEVSPPTTTRKEEEGGGAVEIGESAGLSEVATSPREARGGLSPREKESVGEAIDKDIQKGVVNVVAGGEVAEELVDGVLKEGVA
ncbi:hypothetical protein TeGR_g7877, partial [Tetraparma gracilis]